MKVLNLLLGNSEDVLNSLIEAAVHEACGGQMTIRTTRTASPDDFLRHARSNGYHLAIVIPNNLSSVAGRSVHLGQQGEGVSAISALKASTSTPLVAIAAFDNREQEESMLLKAGADSVLEFPFMPRELMAAVRGLLKLPVRYLQAPPSEWVPA